MVISVYSKEEVIMSQEENNTISPSPFPNHNSHVWESLKSHMNEYTKVGYIIFHVYYENDAGEKVPIENAQIVIAKEIYDSYFFSKCVRTNHLGMTNPIELPTLCADATDDREKNQSCAFYSAIVKASNMKKKDILDIPIFEGVTYTKSIQMIPKK